MTKNVKLKALLLTPAVFEDETGKDPEIPQTEDQGKADHEGMESARPASTHVIVNERCRWVIPTEQLGHKNASETEA